MYKSVLFTLVGMTILTNMGHAQVATGPMQLAVATSEISSAQVVEAAAKAAPHKVFKHHRHAKREESKAHEEKKESEKVIPWTETTPVSSKDQLNQSKKISCNASTGIGCNS